MGLRCNGNKGALISKQNAEASRRSLDTSMVLLQGSPSPSPSPRRGKGIYALHSYMTGLDFAIEPPFECPKSNIGDVAFVKATHSIGDRDTVEEYMACGFFPLSTNFGLGEIVDGETVVSKLTLPLLEFPIARLLGETNDSFQARVELATMNIVGRYAHGEHDTCIAVVSNTG
jgi:hypothetical protein